MPWPTASHAVYTRPLAAIINMINLPFETYNDAKEYFGVNIPEYFFNSLLTIDRYCQKVGLNTLEVLFDIFGILRLEGEEARYQQTPIELFPFGSIGCDGIHYGFVIHTTNEEDFPSGEICPMDSDGVVVISSNSKSLFQNLLWNEENLDTFLPLIKELKLQPIVAERRRYDENGDTLRISVKPKSGWKYLGTSDGVGVLAEDKYFNIFHYEKYDKLNSHKTIELYQNFAREMYNKELYGSQLYYLKELFWNEWGNYTLAIELLKEMLIPYEKLNREHLFDTTKHVIANFNRRFGI